jgi:hypothetical protein
MEATVDSNRAMLVEHEQSKPVLEKRVYWNIGNWQNVRILQDIDDYQTKEISKFGANPKD